MSTARTRDSSTSQFATPHWLELGNTSVCTHTSRLVLGKEMNTMFQINPILPTFIHLNKTIKSGVRETERS